MIVLNIKVGEIEIDERGDAEKSTRSSSLNNLKQDFLKRMNGQVNF